MTRWELARGAVARRAIQKPAELAGLIRWLERRGPVGSVLEVGSYLGGTFWLWSQIAIPAATLVSVDLPGGPEMKGRDAQTVVRVEGDSHDPATLEQVQALGPFDWLFIDGDHTFEGVKADWEMYAPLARWVGFHDIVAHPAYPESGVERFWNGLRADRKVWEFVDGGCGYGIGATEGLLCAGDVLGERVLQADLSVPAA